MTLKTLWASETLIWPLSQTDCEARESNADPAAQRKNKESAFVLCCRGSKVRATPVQSPLDFSCIPATVLQAHTRTYTQTQKLCVIAKPLPGSGRGLGGGRTRPWELQDTGGKMSGAQQRCGESRAETKAKTNPAGPRGATGPQGQSHQLHLGLRVLLDHCFFHGYQILAFELTDYITGWCIVLKVEMSFDTVKGIHWVHADLPVIQLNCWVRKRWQTWTWPTCTS